MAVSWEQQKGLTEADWYKERFEGCMCKDVALAKLAADHEREPGSLPRVKVLLSENNGQW